ncbi:MAG: GNAT family N-acetyltransferase [Verrucomicrobiota bacterium]|nr:GNAT family N-acetyltransferase [Verrucomicrobiota bacterium]
MDLARPPFTLSDDPARLDKDWIVRTLKETYWAGARPEAIILKAMEQSTQYGIYHEDGTTIQQVGFARMVSDHCTFAWLCDVVVAPASRGRGLGKWLVESVTNDPQWNTCTLYLVTRDAHTLYERNGFARHEVLRRSRKVEW